MCVLKRGGQKLATGSFGSVEGMSNLGIETASGSKKGRLGMQWSREFLWVWVW